MAKKSSNNALFAVAGLAGVGALAYAFWPREPQQMRGISWPDQGWRGTDPFYKGNPFVSWRPIGAGSGGGGPRSSDEDGNYDPDSGFAPGYAPGDDAGSYI